ncbi:unnamed protein product, partial [Mesorhabditis belari]|uniref:Uncharacterized protein n=1 Tax=Mesorhabditis belari TaxID=2138241 RepID=A0AAF3J456_9BILA
MAMNSSDPSAPPPLPPVSPDEILFDTLFMAICGALGVIFGVAGVYAVKRNSILKGIIEHYAFVDLLNLILINGCHLFWGVPCALWTLNEVIPFLDHLFGGLAFTAPSIGFPPKLCGSFARWCQACLTQFCCANVNRKFGGDSERLRSDSIHKIDSSISFPTGSSLYLLCLKMSENTTDPAEYPDYEPPEVAQEEILFDILFMAIFGFLGTAFGLGGFYVVKKNSILKGIMEHYAFVDLLNLTIINGCHLFWAVPCALWTVNEAVPFLDNVFGGLAFTAPSISFPPKLFLGINRFTALALEGRFYKAFEKTKILQYIFMIVYPLITAAVYAIPRTINKEPGRHQGVEFGGFGTIFGLLGIIVVKRNSFLKGIVKHYLLIDLLNLVIINGCHLCWGVPCAIWNLNENFPFVDYFFSSLAMSAPSIGFPPKVLAGYIFFPVNTFFDGSVFVMMHRRIRALQAAQHHPNSHLRADQLRKEFKLVSPMLVNLIIGIFLTVTSTIGGYFVGTSSLLSFIIYTAVWQACTLAYCISYVILLRDRKPSHSQTVRVLNVSNLSSTRITH